MFCMCICTLYTKRVRFFTRPPELLIKFCSLEDNIVPTKNACLCHKEFFLGEVNRGN